MDISTTNLKIREGFLGQSVHVVAPPKLKQMTNHAFTSLLYPTAIGYFPLASHHDRERTNGAKDFILIYCIDGHGYVEEKGEKTLLQPNSFYILSKRSRHHYGSLHKKPWSIYWLHFNGEQASLLYRRYKESNQPNILLFDKVRIEKFNSIIKSLNEDLTDTAMELLYINLLNFISSFTHIEVRENDIPEDNISKTIRFMKDQVNKNYQIKELAALANYSITRFSQLFKAKTGYAPMQYFLHLKIQSACQYLTFTKLNIKQIANELGFNDPFYFSRIFKTVIGQSPLNYRKLNLNVE